MSTVYVLLNVLMVLLAAAGAAFTWIRTYDLALQIDRVEGRVRTLQGKSGVDDQQIKQLAKSTAKEAAQKEIEGIEVEGGGGSSEMMEMMMPMLMGQMNGGGQPSPGAGAGGEWSPEQQAENTPANRFGEASEQTDNPQDTPSQLDGLPIAGDGGPDE